MKKKLLKSAAIHPILFSIFPILLLFFYNAKLLPSEEVVIPLLISAVLTFLIWILIGIILKNRIKAGLIVSLGLGLFFSYSFFYNLVDDIVWDGFYVRHHYLLFIFLISFAVGTFYFVKTKRKLETVTKFLNAFAALLIVVSFIGISEIGSQENLPNTLLQNS